MKAEILCVGTELLLGQVLNTNSQFLSIQLNDLGYDVYRQIVVGDNASRLEQNIKESLARVDVLIMTGGLGPTKDDLTKETVAHAIGEKLVLDLKSAKRLKNYFIDKREAFNENKKQSYFPKSAVILPNDMGTAPGALIFWNNKKILILPGPPKEMETMFLKYAKALLAYSQGEFYSEKIWIAGMGEWEISKKLNESGLWNLKNPTVATYIDHKGLYIRVTSKMETQQKAEEEVKKISHKIQKNFGLNFVGINEEDLITKTGHLLMKENCTISFAESVTGGMMASKLVGVSGISKVFKESYIVYSDEVKIKNLNVSKHTLKKYSAVSREVCQEMLQGLKEKSNADYCVATTGYAQEGEESSGLVYIGVYNGKTIHIEEKKYKGNRHQVRLQATMDGVNLLRKKLLEDVSRETN